MPPAAVPIRKSRMKTVAVVASCYRPHSHADVAVGKLLNGYPTDAGPPRAPPSLSRPPAHESTVAVHGTMLAIIKHAQHPPLSLTKLVD